MRSRETGFQILAMAAMFARIFFKRKVHHIVPWLQGQRDFLVVLKYHKKKSGKVALAREKFSNFCDKTKLPIQYLALNQTFEVELVRTSSRFRTELKTVAHV